MAGVANLCASLQLQYVCHPDPMALYQKYGQSYKDGIIALGVKQRIDGNEAEIQGIKRVIQLMNQYVLEEVISNADFTYVLPQW